MKHKPVMKRHPMPEILFFLFMLFFCSAVSLGSMENMWCYLIMIIFAVANRLPDWWRSYRFQSSPKKITEACIVDRQVKRHDGGKGGPSYTHLVTYQFYTLEDEKAFNFEEKVSEELYNSLSFGTLLTVEYAIGDPGLARSSLPRVKELSSLEVTDARIIERRVKPTRKNGTTHHLTYQFEDIANRRTFTIEEKVSQEVYNWVNIGTSLTVEYAQSDPRFARRSPAKAKKAISGIEEPMMPLLGSHSILQERYRIISLLAEGGFGAVYQAQDMRLQNHLVAVKENLDTSYEAQKQFAREAQLLANLSHANLPRVSDHFIEPSGKQYLVMDFIEGRDVQEILKEEGILPESQALGWVHQICDALEYLHDQNPPIIHRDIKPSNIRITPEGKAMLVDFGIAKQLEEGNQTVWAARAVTAGFSPPEQYGSGGTDARSDIYALGATLYQMLTGVIPPEATDRMNGQQFILPRAVNPQISSAIEQVIQQSLALAPRNRPQSISQLREMLMNAAYSVEETPVYPETPEEASEPMIETPVYSDAPEG